MYAQMAPENKSANQAMWTGIAALVLGWCTLFIPNVAAAILGHLALREIRRTGEAGRGKAVAALWMAYTPVALFTLGVTLTLIQN